MTDAGWSADFTGHEPIKNVSVPSGTYAARVANLEWGKTSDESKMPGEDKLTVTFKLDGGNHDGREMTRTYTFKSDTPEKTKVVMGYFMQFCEATGKIPADVMGGQKKITAKHLAATQGAEVALRIVQKTATRPQDKEYADDNGQISRINAIHHIDSEQGRRAVSAKNRDPLAPKR